MEIIICLCTDNQPEANEINEADQQDKFGELMVKLLEKNKKCNYAIAKETTENRYNNCLKIE